VAAYLYARNKRFEESIELSKKDKVSFGRCMRARACVWVGVSYVLIVARA
jgi:hypothetical protein